MQQSSKTAECLRGVKGVNGVKVDIVAHDEMMVQPCVALHWHTIDSVVPLDRKR